MPTGPHVTPEICDLISKLFVKDPTLRLGAQNIDDLLNHDVFKGTDFESAYDTEPPLRPAAKKLTR